MSFPDRFELLEPLRQDDEQTFRARERATGRIVEVRFLSPGLSQSPPPGEVIEQGDHDGKRYVVTTAAATEAAALDSAGAWRIRPAGPQPASSPGPSGRSSAEPGDFTRMFQLRQAPEPAPLPASKPAQPEPAAQPGEFTRAFQRPAAAPVAVPEGVSTPGQAGDFTRMFQTPASAPVAATAPDSVPPPPVAASHSMEPGIQTPPVAPARIHTLFIVGAIVLCAIVVFVLVRKLY